jgi:hypothetical protein
MKSIQFAVGALVLTLTWGGATSALNFSPHISDYPLSSSVELLALQDTQKTLTNDDVVKMLAAGLAESTILQVIQKLPSNFDTSPDALIKLKQQAVPPQIIEAMVSAKNAPAKPAPTEPIVTNKGVFAQNGPDWKRIEEVSSIEVRNVGEYASRATFGIKEVRVVCVFRGEKADLQLDNRRPVFRLSGLGASARDVYIVSMRLNPDRRDLEMGRAGLIKKMSYGFRKRDVRDVAVKRLGDDLLEVTPKQDLEPGEYIMVLGGVAVPLNTPGGRSRTAMPAPTEGTTGYDFGIKVADKLASK